MNMLDVTIDVIYQRARETSAGDGIDEHWKRVLPEAIHCAANEIFLVLHRAHVNPLMEQNAALFAQTLPPRDIDNFDNATLMLHCFTREWLLRMSKEYLFPILVDESYGVDSNTTDADRWVRPSLIWVPDTHVIAPQIHCALVERYNHYSFLQRCYAEIVRRGREHEYIKYTFILLDDFPGMHREQDEAMRRLCDHSRRIATDVGADPDLGQDALHNHLKTLLAEPLHRQIKRCGATGKAIHDGVIDMHYRKGGRYEHVHFDDDLINTMPDESEDTTTEELIVEEYGQRLLECQLQIEAILSRGSAELGKRRFKVMQLLAHTPHLTSSEIAKKLKKSEPTMKVSEPTISRDRKVIKQNKDRINAVLQN